MMLNLKNKAFSLLAVYSLGLFFSLLPNLSIGNVVIHKVCKNKKIIIQQSLTKADPSKEIALEQNNTEDEQSSNEINTELNTCTTTLLLVKITSTTNIQLEEESITFHYAQFYQNPDQKCLVNPPEIS